MKFYKKRLIYTSSSYLLKNIDIFIITVPTPINDSNQPDLTMLEKASKLVGNYIKKKTIVIYNLPLILVVPRKFAFLS